MQSKRQNNTAISIDLGATNLRVALVDRKGKILKHFKIKTPKKAACVVKKIESTIKKTLRADDIKNTQGVGISIAGPVKREKGTAQLTNIGTTMKKVPFTQPLRKSLGKNIFLINDGEAAALGEKYFGKWNTHNLLFITISTGIGGAAIKNNKLVINKQGLSDEVGHQTMSLPYKIKCPCGKHDHWESYGSGTNMPIFLKVWAKSKGYKIPKIDIFEIFEAARKKDPKILEFIKEVAKIDAQGINMAVKKHKPQIVILSGNVFLKNKDILLPRIKQYLNTNVRIVPSKLGDNPSILGAAAYVFENK